MIDKITNIPTISKEASEFDDNVLSNFNTALEEDDIYLASAIAITTPNINARGNYHKTLLYMSAYHNNFEIAKLLIERGANVNIKISSNRTPLHASIDQKKSDVTELLIKNGADVNHKDDYECRPLYDAVKIGNLKTVKLLVEHTAKVNAKNLNDKTALHAATEYDVDIQIAELLIQNGADVNAANDHCITPLFYAIMNDNLNMVKFLYDYGANLTVIAIDYNNQLTTPLDTAISHNNLEIINFLKENGARTISELNIK